MWLKHLILLNWGNLPNRSYEFGSINLFSGGSGSGKTTMGDALQTLMTAAYDSLYQYNPGQNESKQRSKSGKQPRSLASYVLGCDDGSYARLNPTDGYIVGVFHPSANETSPPFTALMGIRAYIDQTAKNKVARQDSLVFMVLPEIPLDKSDLVIVKDNTESIITLDQIEAHFIKIFGKQGFEIYDKKKAYLRRLYGAFQGLKESVAEQEAMAAARAFSRFMAYKPIDSIDDFVSSEVLEERNLGDVIQDISRQLRSIHGMEKDAKQIKHSVALLKQADNYAQNYIESWLALKTLDYMLAQNNYLQIQKKWLDTRKAIDEKEGVLKNVEKDIISTGEHQKALHDEQVSLEAKRQGIPALQQKDELEKQIDNEQGKLVEKFQRAGEQNVLLSKNHRQIEFICNQLQQVQQNDELAKFRETELTSFCQQFKKTEIAEKIDLKLFMDTSILDDSDKVDGLIQQVKSKQSLHNNWYSYWHQVENEKGVTRFQQVEKDTRDKQRHYQSLKLKETELTKNIRRLESKKKIYPPYVVDAVNAIRKQYPEADPVILCDYIEVADIHLDWQASIEGYIGGARFSIIVDERYEAKAISLVKSLSNKRAKVIQGERAKRDVEERHHKLDQRSIIHTLEFDHAIAKYYLTASYGNVLRVDNAEELRMERRAITKDGMGAGSYSMWARPMPDEQLVFGESARLKALMVFTKELEELEQELNQVNDEMNVFNRFLEAVTALSLVEIIEPMEQMVFTHQQLETLERRIEQLDLGEGEKLEDQISKLAKKKAEVDESLVELNQNVGKLGGDIKVLRKESNKLSDQKDVSQEVVVSREEKIQGVAEIWAEFDLEKHLEHAQQEAQSLSIQIKENEKKEVENSLNSYERSLAKKLSEHNQDARSGDGVFFQGYEGQFDKALFKRICDTQIDIKRVYNSLKNNVLVEMSQRLGKIRSHFDNAFITNFCHTIYSALNAGKQQIEQLNKELQNHHFGADNEQFRFDSKWMPEYKGYASFFREVVDNPQLGERSGLFDDEAEFSEKVLPIRDEIKSMLLDNESNKAQLELKRISDYRNYRCYEIYKEVEGKEPIPLSRYGTGSGGQLETPAYIIRSASITSAFRFSKGKNHLGMVLVDEAFSFMDEPRSREIINYLTKSLGLQLIFIMPSNKSGPFMDMVNNQFVFVKSPSSTLRGELKTQVQVDAKVLREEEIGKLWEQHKEMTYQQGELSFMNSFEES